MQKSLLAFATIAALGLSAQATPLDPAKSSVKFVFTQMNVPVEGQFKKLAGDVSFDAAKPEAGKASLTVDLGGADAGSSDANQALVSAEFFDVAHFPKASFTATQFKALGGGKYQVTGQFSLKGRSAPISIPFTARPDGSGQWLEGAFPLSRLGWKIGTGEWADVGSVADAVQVKFKLFVPK
ncbi:MAG: YceI family protein [Burkholderiales bacterium]|nr:YceI family protein [Burkholderiales bacterium]